MAFARDAASARWTPLLLTAAAMFCLLAAFIGWPGLDAAAGSAGPTVNAVSGDDRSQSGDPLPDRPTIAVQAFAVGEKEAESGRPGKTGAPVWTMPLLSSAGTTPTPAVPAPISLPTRPPRSHLSQAPPLRA
ncbi:hypothetical protein [uncultured Stenotrophomonas sp.]|uniref:hypothetical protein n=1 Tax=uncultured Stenotrophomonas sp. TaxID=165438 RepID=UPI0028ED6F78|nr:hypothetical protein [uncultured Stenotrophomonas sp.]